jgi:hypothetical protein
VGAVSRDVARPTTGAGTRAGTTARYTTGLIERQIS